MGVYLLTENIKINHHRLNIPKDENHYLVELDKYYDNKDSVVKTTSGRPLKIHYPKNCGEACRTPLKKYVDEWEKFIQTDFDYDTLTQNWIDIHDYTAYYWVEEFSKNVDSNLRTSVFFIWEKDKKIKMGPVWDFDLSYGEYRMYSPKDWYSYWGPWNTHLFKNAMFKQYIKSFWQQNRQHFLNSLDSLDAYREFIRDAAQNNFKPWPVQGTTFLWEFNRSYDNHNEAVDSLKSWMQQRIQWIDENL